MIDVLCVGHAAYDLTFAVPHHPAPDEKTFATRFAGCGGGPAANAAVTVAKLGGRSAFAGYLGQDMYGDLHLAELAEAGVDTSLVVRGTNPTPLSVIWAKPDGRRSLVNYRGETRPQSKTSEVLKTSEVWLPKVVLFDGWEPDMSLLLAQWAAEQGIPTVLDAGSVHRGTVLLASKVDYLVTSEKFGLEFTGAADVETAVSQLSQVAETAVITLGARGLIWQNTAGSGFLPAYPVQAVDTTGAGDTFHGAFAYALAQAMPWSDLLRYASAAAALCCTKHGARLGIPTSAEITTLQRVQSQQSA
ncbi:MAG: carbohydrate kinase [Anaerolineae bacterium]|nr:carbohydrate kinase [Anaerolineae bacterium]